MSFSVNVNKVDDTNVTNFLISITPDMLALPMQSIDGLSSGAAVIWVHNFAVAGTSSSLPKVIKYELVETFAAVEALLAAAGVASVSLASPALTGTPTAPTAATSTSTTQIASTAFVQANFTAKVAKLSSTPLVAGVLVVSNSLITANSAVSVQRIVNGGTAAVGGYKVTLNAGVGYTITALQADCTTTETSNTDTVVATIVY